MLVTPLQLGVRDAVKQEDTRREEVLLDETVEERSLGAGVSD